MKIDYILVDIDGCMLSTNGDVSISYFHGLHQLSRYISAANHGYGPSIGFCTGRDRNYVEAVSFVAGLPDSLSVIESGIALFNPTTKELLLNPALTPEVREAFREMSEERMPQILERYPGLFLYPGNMLNIALERRFGTDLTIEDCYQAIKEELKDLDESGLINIHHSDIAIDISPAGIDKASGVQFLSRLTGINLAKTLGIGDSNGDFPMLEQMGFVGCPANASKECKELVKAKRGYVSLFSYARGVADIIEHFT